MERSSIDFNLIAIITITFIFPLAFGFFITNDGIWFTSVTLHTALEASAGIIAIAVATILLAKSKHKREINHYYWSAIALYAMGIFDFLHSLTEPGDLFILLQSLAVFFGGLFSLLVWVPKKTVNHFLFKLIPFIFVSSILFLAVIILLFNYIIPPMREINGEFIPFAIYLNLIGGVSFFITAVFFIKLYFNKKNKENLILIGFTLLFSSSALLFQNSVIWDTQWWIWNFMRFIAYCIALYLIYVEFTTELEIIAKQNNELLEMQEKAQKYLDIIDKNVVISTTNTKGRIIDVTQAFCDLTGYTKDELIGNYHEILRLENVPNETYEELWDTIRNNKVWKGELQNQKKDGSLYWIKATITPIINDNGKKMGYTSIREDITDKKTIEQISLTDPLTGLGNRRYYDKILSKFINRAKRDKKTITYSILDIDHFKLFNDNYGHKLGDIALESLSRKLKGLLKRSNDFAFRIGGEEFCLLYESEDDKKALAFSQKIVEAIESLHITHEYNSASKFLTISMGSMIIESHEVITPDDLYKKADALLYLAKEKGKNRVITNKWI